MEKRLSLITCLLIFWGCVGAEHSQDGKDDQQMEILVDNISELAAKVLEIFEPIAAKASNGSGNDPDNTYFVSFLLRDRKNKTSPTDDGKPRQRMVVNNNFSGERMGTSQIFVESGQTQKQPPSHNIQMLNKRAQEPQGQQARQQRKQNNYG